MAVGKKLSVQDINPLRIQAVKLRLAGKTLKEIGVETGLSAPTIISAHKAWQTGGWNAVLIRERGRKPGEGRSLSAMQEQDIYVQLVSTQPADHGLPFLLWQLEAMQQLIALRQQLELPERTTAQYLQRWNLNADRPIKRMQQSSTAVQRWYASTYFDICEQAKKEQASVVWIDDFGAHSNCPGRLRHGILRAVNNRGKVHWQPYEGSLRKSHLEDFFDRLQRASDCKIFALLPAMQWQRAATFSSLASDRCDRLRLFHLPAATELLSQSNELASSILKSVQSAATDTKTAPIQTPTPLQLDPMASMTQHLLKHQLAQKFGSTGSYSSQHRKPKTKEKSVVLTHLQRLEAESIQAMREVVAEADNPVMLYSIGKDSAVMLHLAMKAFYPAKPPFPLLHVDTTWKFQDMYRFRDQMVSKLGMDLLVHINPDGIEMGISPFKHGSQTHTDIMKTEGLKQALDKYGFDAAFGGARRDEEKSRAKERIFSFRSDQHRWDPKNQRPELWHLYNARKNKGESIRVFPLSNWTELDIWQYIYLENIPIVPLYFSAPRPVVERDGTLLMVDDARMPLKSGEVPMMRNVRFRTLGCYPLTGAVESDANSLPKIIQEMLLTRTSERQGRMIDHDSAASMEKKKQEGYF
ncbi:sulfate adenylyltransferase subunit CysD [Diaphorobacter sp. HDW4A]|nr:sulfate adenylyltransferase subunit CysD [Diaphorobacter sp. HDW4A]